jgi:hypothetical protein
MKVKIIDNLAVATTGSLLKLAKLRDEPYECLPDPVGFIDKLKEAGTGADVFTFLQEISDTVPQYHYRQESHSLAVLPITTYEHWWKKQVNDKTRNMVRKAQKTGIEMRRCDFNDEFVKGIVSIYSESPIRQGKAFAHYGKGFDQIKAEHQTFLERSEFIGVFLQAELVGFIKLFYGRKASSLMQIISKISVRDKAPNNALIAKAVEICAERNIHYLHYGIWSQRALGDFKKHHGFLCMNVPRYYVPLNGAGRVMLKLNLQRRPSEYIPEQWWERIVSIRNRWNLLRHGKSKGVHASPEALERRV